jgi:hypothetical protein
MLFHIVREYDPNRCFIVFNILSRPSNDALIDGYFGQRIEGDVDVFVSE